jgi:predicted metal-dependent peptidase
MNSTEEKIKRARIQLQLKNPFFSYLSLFLKFKEIGKGEMLCDSMGVDLKGNVYYVKEFVDELEDEELIGVIAHEIGHLVFLTQLREGGRDKTGWNFATDITINSLLSRNNFSLPKGVLIPSYNDEVKLGEVTIEKCSEKLSEEIYEELPKMEEDESNYYVEGEGSGKGKGEKQQVGKRFDEHLKGEELTQSEKRELQKEWNDRVQEAVTTARMKGDLPVGMERILGKLHEEKINWKGVLNRFITQQIPYNYSYAKPSKKSISVGEYMPYIEKEKIDIVIGIDTSGSISEVDLTDFLSEIIGIARAYQERIDMTLIPCDCEIKETYQVRNGDIEKIKNNVKMKGGGGTEFKPVIDWIKENKRDTKCLIYLTDGYGSKVEKQHFDILWVLTKDGSDELIKDSGEVIELKD